MFYVCVISYFLYFLFLYISRPPFEKISGHNVALHMMVSLFKLSDITTESCCGIECPNLPLSSVVSSLTIGRGMPLLAESPPITLTPMSIESSPSAILESM